MRHNFYWFQYCSCSYVPSFINPLDTLFPFSFPFFYVSKSLLWHSELAIFFLRDESSAQPSICDVEDQGITLSLAHLYRHLSRLGGPILSSYRHIKLSGSFEHAIRQGGDDSTEMTWGSWEPNRNWYVCVGFSFSGLLKGTTVGTDRLERGTCAHTCERN